MPLYGVGHTVEAHAGSNMKRAEEAIKKALTFTRDGRFVRELTE
ncbi:MAG TPA: hypothetical protein VF001_03895 [Candidatus Limnocylindria bacterium]